MTGEHEPAVALTPLMQLVSGYSAFKTLAAAHELGLFRHLSKTRGTTATELSAALNIDERPAEVLLTGCAALGLVEKQSGRYRNTSLSEEFLVPGKPTYFGGAVAIIDKHLYPEWMRLTEAIRSNRPTMWHPDTPNSRSKGTSRTDLPTLWDRDTQKSLFGAEDPTMLELLWDAIHAQSTFTGRALGEVIDLGSHRQLLDLGGGSGACAIELCRRYSKLQATVYDLPFVCEIAAKKVADAGLSDRIVTVPGDFFADQSLPQGHDVVLLSMIMHDWSETRDREILRKCHDALPSDGLVIISDLLVNDEKTGPLPAALMSLQMLIETEGRNYTPSEYAEWLRDAGFSEIRTVWFEAAGANGAVIARKPAA